MKNDKHTPGRGFVRRRDALLIGALLAVAFAVWVYGQQLRGGEAGHAEVVYRGVVVRSVSLDSPGRFSIPELPEVEFETRNGAAAFVHSNCPDQVCVNTGWLRIPGDFAACLPNQVLLSIPAEDNGLDAITR